MTTVWDIALAEVIEGQNVYEVHKTIDDKTVKMGVTGSDIYDMLRHLQPLLSVWDIVNEPSGRYVVLPRIFAGKPS